jgi:hypothetical protein
MSAQSAFPPTAVGVCELKVLPAGTLLKSEGSGEYFENANGLFMPLFRYISSHDIKMTTPVEAQVDSAAMYFWVAKGERPKVTGSEGGVKVIEVPERQVASMGGRGGYDRKNFEATRDALLAWIGKRADVEPSGPAYPVYWNAPFVPWFLKTYEVHIPVGPKKTPS